MLRLLTLLVILFSAQAFAADQPQKPKIIIEGVAIPEEPVPAEQYNLTNKITSMLFSLGAIIICVMVVTFILKKLAKKRITAANLGNSIKILEKRSLNPKTTLYVVEAHNKTLLIGESAAGLTTLSELSPDVEEEPVTTVAPLSFTQILRRKFEELKP